MSSLQSNNTFVSVKMGRDGSKFTFSKNYINAMEIKVLTIKICMSQRKALSDIFSLTVKYWIGVQRDQSYLMGRRCLFSLGWQSF